LKTESDEGDYMTTETRSFSSPLATLADTERGFAHVNRGKVDAFRALGLQLVIGAREGARFQDAYSGRWYWNCHCNGGVFNLGHRNPRVVDAVRTALDELDIGNHHLMSPWRAVLAERLVATTGGRLGGVVLGVSGSEVVDTAVKLARGTTGRAEIVSAQGAYHGITGFSMAAGDPPYREPFGEGAAGFTQVPWNDLDALDAAVGPQTAAVLLEAIPATLGFPPPAPGYLREAARIARERGALLVIDEVQTGLGRTGTVWFHEQEDVEPDAIVVGKGLSGGVYPIAALLTSAAMHEVIDANPFAHSSTFGGAELGCVAALAVLDVVSEPAFLQRVRTLGERFEAGLAGLPFELRRRGMTMAFAFAEEGGGMSAAQRLLEAGVFAVWANNDPRVLQFKPPLTTTDEEADEILALVRGVFAG
jgi:acetylornithine/succinyldiaminopimelate/putrescine aminotransferase